MNSFNKHKWRGTQSTADISSARYCCWVFFIKSCFLRLILLPFYLFNYMGPVVLETIVRRVVVFWILYLAGNHILWLWGFGNYYTMAMVWILLWVVFTVVAVTVDVVGYVCIIKWQKVFHPGESRDFEFHFECMKACFVGFKLVTTGSCIGSVHSRCFRF